MPVLDFKEIAEAHLATGEQDQFELFARDYLEYLGYKILSHPSRGADQGVDIMVEEKRIGIGGETPVKWLVSCKHQAHSGRSVSTKDESNVRDRVDANGCAGFIGIYSTLPSTGLKQAIDGLKVHIETQIIDREIIEKEILRTAKGVELAKRYFPKSIEKWISENPKPAKLFSEPEVLRCSYCKKDLLKPEPSGIIVFWERALNDFNDTSAEYVEHIYWCCKGRCDNNLGASYKNQGLVDSWEDIPDIIIPQVYIKWVMTIFNQLKGIREYSNEAFEQLKEFMLNVYPYIARHPTTKEKKRLKSLLQIPSVLGGMGS